MILAIDTSGRQTSVAIANRLCGQTEGFFDMLSSEDRESHSGSLSCLYQEILRRNKLSQTDLKSIIIGAGPGSFTGLRIGYSFAKGLSVGLQIPVFSVSSLKAAAWSARGMASTVIALEDARRNEFFVAAYSISDRSFKCIATETILSDQQIRDLIEANRDAVVVTADRAIADSFNGALAVTDNAKSLIEIALSEGMISGVVPAEVFDKDYYLQLSAMAPLYIRAVAAKTIEERAKNST